MERFEEWIVAGRLMRGGLGRFENAVRHGQRIREPQVRAGVKMFDAARMEQLQNKRARDQGMRCSTDVGVARIWGEG